VPHLRVFGGIHRRASLPMKNTIGQRSLNCEPVGMAMLFLGFCSKDMNLATIAVSAAVCLPLPMMDSFGALLYYSSCRSLGGCALTDMTLDGTYCVRIEIAVACSIPSSRQS
jgi:hypothetical protein